MDKVNEQPQERVYAFQKATGVKDVNGNDVLESVNVPESQLTEDQCKALAKELIRVFESMPGATQDMFLGWIDATIMEAQQRYMAEQAAKEGKSGSSGLILIPGQA